MFPDLHAERSTFACDLAADRSKAHHKDTRTLQAAHCVALPVFLCLHRLEIGDVPEKIEQAEHRKLGQRAGVHASGGRKYDAGLVQTGPLQELADAHACRLDPFQPRRVLWHFAGSLKSKSKLMSARAR